MNPYLSLDLLPPVVFIDGMAWPVPKYSRNKVDAAGDLLFNTTDWGQYLLWGNIEESLDVVNNWRSSHAYPLQVIKMNLKRRAQAIESDALVYQRLKRMEAIKIKMSRNAVNGRSFGLSTMQDLGGCRAIMPSVDSAELLVDVYRKADAKNPDRGVRLAKPFDYIAKPKVDGYRGVHLVYRYHCQSHNKNGESRPTKFDLSCFDGLKIEIQIRSELQHQWASAVETAGRYTKQDIKGQAGEAKWARFFALTSTAIAMMEERPLVPDTPTEKGKLIKEILKHGDQLELLKRYTAPVQDVEDGTADLGAGMFILVVDPESGKLQARPFTKKRLVEAQDAYFSVEKAIRNTQGVDAVLVEVDSLEMLKAAYPSYFLDARDFVKTLESFMS